MERVDRHEDMRGIGPLGAARLDPAPDFAGGEEGIQQPLDGVMGPQAYAKIMQQGEGEAEVMQLTFRTP